MRLDPKWYVIQVMTGSELETARRLQEAGMEALAPVEVLHERRHGKWWPVRRVVFPSYVFVRVGLTPRVYHHIQRLPRVIRLLGGETPSPVPEEEMEPVLLLSPDGRDFEVSRLEQTDGRVAVTSGPLAALEDRITKVNARGRRATVEIGVLGETHQVEVGVIVTRPSSRAQTAPST